MSGTTSRGVPYATDGDSNDLGAVSKSLAQWVDARPGIATLSTTQRNALASAELWAGRVIFNTTTGAFEAYDGTVWVPLISKSDPVVVTLTPQSGGWNGNVAYAERGGVVIADVAILRAAFNPGDGIMIFPPGFRPPFTVRTAGASYDDAQRFMAVDPNGQLRVDGSHQHGGGIFGSIVFPVA